MNKAGAVLGIVVAVLVALGAAWLWGASGRWEAQRALGMSELQNDLLDARSAVLDARLAIYSVNFGEASRHLEDARGLLRRADERLKGLGRQEDAKQLEPAITQIDEAQRLAGRLDQDANSRAGDAAKTLSDVLASLAPAAARK